MIKTKNKKLKTFLKLIGGVFIGFINGFFGVGGGMVAVPFMTHLLGEQDKKAHATAILIILPLSIVSGVVYIAQGAVEWDTLIKVTIGIILGGILGAFLLNKMNNKLIAIIFSLITIAAGVKMMF